VARALPVGGAGGTKVLHDRIHRLEQFGISLQELATFLSATAAEIEQWIAGVLSTEEADILEVGMSLLEMRLSHARARRNEPTERVAALAA
jgi:hypothetical protein